MNTEITIIFSIMTFIITLVFNYFAFVIKVKTDITELQGQYKIFWKVIEPHLANIIHSPVHTRRDFLVEKMVNKKTDLTLCETDELIRLLEECTNGDNPAQKLPAALLMARAVVWKAVLMDKSNVKRGLLTWG